MLHWVAAWMVLCLLATQAAGLLHRIGHGHGHDGRSTHAAALAASSPVTHAAGCEHDRQAHAHSWVLHLADALHGANSNCADVDHQLCADAQTTHAVTLLESSAVEALNAAPSLQAGYSVRLAPWARGPPAAA